MRCRWSSWWTKLCCVCACGKDCSIISCYQLILNVYRHFNHFIYNSHTLNSIWGQDMGDTHAPIHRSLHTTVLKIHNKGYGTVLFLVNKVPHGTSPSFQTWLSLCSWKKELDKSKTKHQHYLKSRFEHTQTHLNRVGRWEPLI